MDETSETVSPEGETTKILESPKPVAFTVDFGENKQVDPQKYKNLVEKYQNRHRRGQSLSKIEEPNKPTVKKHPLTGNLPRKSGYHAEGYHSSDEKMEKFKIQGARSSVLNSVMKKGDLTLPIKPISSERMTQSYPTRSFDLPVIDSPEVEIKDISSPELEPMSPISPVVTPTDVKLQRSILTSNYHSIKKETDLKMSGSSSDEVSLEKFESCLDFDRTDTVSDAGTYTIEADNYTEEQKQRMSIDKDFNIEQVSVLTKTREYIQNLILGTTHQEAKQSKSEVVNVVEKSSIHTHSSDISPQPQRIIKTEIAQFAHTHAEGIHLNNMNGRATKVLNSNQNTKNIVNTEQEDRGVFTLVTTSGVLNKRQNVKEHNRQHSLVKSVIAVETYPTSELSVNSSPVVQSVYTVAQQSHNGVQRHRDSPTNLVCSLKQSLIAQNSGGEVIDVNGGRVASLPPSVGGTSGKNSPSKLPSPLHSTRNRSYVNCESDSSLETESYLQPTQNIISSLQQRLSLDSDSDNDLDRTYSKLPLNNEAKILSKTKPVHVRHNSFDDRNIKIQNKLEHFHNKNLQGIDQTLKACNQNRAMHQLQNSPNNSPIKRSSSFSLKNHFDNQTKCLNIQVNNYRKSSNSQSGSSIQRSSSTANIRPKSENLRRASINSDGVDRNNYVDSESTSEDDFDKTITKNKKDLTSTRYNRAFSLRRARLDVEPPVPKCPNTPEMRRKFGPSDRGERPASVDRKPKSADVQSRYMNISRITKNVPSKPEPPKPAPKCPPKSQSGKTVFSRTDSGRFSLRSPKPASAPAQKTSLRPNVQSKIFLFMYFLCNLYL